ncbi:MAG: DUF3793 family protein [Eubacteriales bacterium]
MNYSNMIKALSGKEYISCMIAFSTAPTILRIKPSSILTLKGERKNVLQVWNIYKDEICSDLGLEYLELVYRDYSTTVLFYKSQYLSAHLQHEYNYAFLHLMGYDKGLTLEEKLFILKKRFKNHCPHEMGIFLGIPVEDVRGFMEHEGRNCLMCRYWKVYHNPVRAVEIFEKFDLAKKIMINALLQKHAAA